MGPAHPPDLEGQEQREAEAGQREEVEERAHALREVERVAGPDGQRPEDAGPDQHQRRAARPARAIAGSIRSVGRGAAAARVRQRRRARAPRAPPSACGGARPVLGASAAAPCQPAARQRAGLLDPVVALHPAPERAEARVDPGDLARAPVGDLVEVPEAQLVAAAPPASARSPTITLRSSAAPVARRGQRRRAPARAPGRARPAGGAAPGCGRRCRRAARSPGAASRLGRDGGRRRASGWRTPGGRRRRAAGRIVVGASPVSPSARRSPVRRAVLEAGRRHGLLGAAGLDPGRAQRHLGAVDPLDRVADRRARDPRWRSGRCAPRPTRQRGHARPRARTRSGRSASPAAARAPPPARRGCAPRTLDASGPRSSPCRSGPSARWRRRRGTRPPPRTACRRPRGGAARGGCGAGRSAIRSSAPASMQDSVPQTWTCATEPTGRELEHEVEGRDLERADVGHARACRRPPRWRASKPALLLLGAPQERDDRAGLPALGILADLRLGPGEVRGREGEGGGLVGVEAAEHQRGPRTRAAGGAGDEGGHDEAPSRQDEPGGETSDAVVRQDAERGVGRAPRSGPGDWSSATSGVSSACVRLARSRTAPDVGAGQDAALGLDRGDEPVRRARPRRRRPPAAGGGLAAPQAARSARAARGGEQSGGHGVPCRGHGHGAQWRSTSSPVAGSVSYAGPGLSRTSATRRARSAAPGGARRARRRSARGCASREERRRPPRGRPAGGSRGPASPARPRRAPAAPSIARIAATRSSRGAGRRPALAGSRAAGRCPPRRRAPPPAPARRWRRRPALRDAAASQVVGEGREGHRAARPRREARGPGGGVRGAEASAAGAAGGLAAERRQQPERLPSTCASPAATRARAAPARPRGRGPKAASPSALVIAQPCAAAPRPASSRASARARPRRGAARASASLSGRCSRTRRRAWR